MSAPVLLHYAESGDYTERKKKQTQDNVAQNPGEACAEQRQGGEQSNVARFGVHSRFRLERGSDQAAPSSVRELMALNRLIRPPAAGRQAIFLGATEPRAARPKEIRRGATPVGQGRLAVSTVGKNAYIDARSRRANNLNMTIVQITGCSGLQLLFGKFAKFIGNGL